MPRAFIEAERVFRQVATFKRDRKAYEDARPRIQRTAAGMSPMQVVVGDVHHLDIVMQREDGSEAWPKAIAWLGLATRRARLDIVLLGKGEGIRNADVIRSFVAMTQDPRWGMPRTLYLDNGSEYRWSAFVDDAMKLVERVELFGQERPSHVVKARPYNAPAKAIEGFFRNLEYQYLSTLPGWAGGDRTNKRTAAQGKSTEPFPGGLGALCGAIAGALALYEAKPQRGDLRGRSPAQVFDAAVKGGWARTAVDGRDLRTVFAVPQLRDVRQGCISFGGRKWTCPELHGFLGERVTIRVPKFEEPTMLPLYDGERPIGLAAPAPRYGILDPAGAKTSADAAARHRAAVRALDKSVPDISTTAEIIDFAARRPPAAIPPIGGTITFSEDITELSAALAEPPEVRRDRQREESLRRNRERAAMYEAINRKLGLDV